MCADTTDSGEYNNKSVIRLYTKESAQAFIEALKVVKAEEARKFFLLHGYSASSFEMPKYYTAGALDQISLKDIEWNERDEPRITQPLEFLTPKGFLGWRSFSLLHPYIYIHIVNQITQADSWKKLLDILTTESLVHSYSTPGFDVSNDGITKKQAIDRWILMAENDLVKDAIGFSFLTVTDIKNFYPSIYTHSIAWAIEGKNVVREGRRRDHTLLGNRLDKLFQNARDGQTNGIPVGSMVSDFVAEIILKRVDVTLSKWIEERGISDEVIVTRYRDDYRILSCSYEHGKEILKQLGKILNTDYNLSLNEEKTKIHNDIIEGTMRDWSSEINDDFLLRQVKYEEMQENVTFHYLSDILLKIYRIQKKYPNGRPSITLLSKLTTHLDSDKVSIEINESGIYTLISVLRKLSLVREEASSQIFMLLDTLFGKLPTDTRKSLISEMLQTIQRGSDYDYQVVWLYRLCMAHEPEICKDVFDKKSSKLLELLDDEHVSGAKDDLSIFSGVENLSAEDSVELKKFFLVNKLELDKSRGVDIDKESLLLFSYRQR